MTVATENKNISDQLFACNADAKFRFGAIANSQAHALCSEHVFRWVLTDIELPLFMLSEFGLLSFIIYLFHKLYRIKMFPTSTQKNHWMFNSLAELDEMRAKTNQKAGTLLTAKEEHYMVRSYLVNLKEFCRKFMPPMRKSVIATAFVYMKRFYLQESCMEYHPRNIGVTCAYLACKVDEFNVSIDQFIKNVKGDCRKAQTTVLSNELLLMKKLRFHLTVHLPNRAVEGFLIDLRARYHPAKDKTDIMLIEIEDFLDKAMFTDACFLYTPSQIALAAVCYGGDKCNVDLASYLNDIIFDDQPEALERFQNVCTSIQQLIEKDLQDSPGKDVIKKIEKKMQENQC